MRVEASMMAHAMLAYMPLPMLLLTLLLIDVADAG